MPLLDILTFLGVVLVAILVVGALAPLETLGWWAGWFGRPREASPPQPTAATKRDTHHYLVFLSGIHSVAGPAFAYREIDLLAELRGHLPGVEVVEVFPYSVTNRALTGQRAFAWFWRWALSMKLSHRTLTGVAGSVINLRNLWQVLVSADRRYGPLYNHGSAELIVDALLEHGYDLDSHPAITLVGYSGGGQIAVGAAGFIKELLGTKVSVISLGGVLSADPGLAEVSRLYYLTGRRDRIHRVGKILFSGRWPLLRHSSWNQAKAQGRVRLVDLGPVDHTGSGGYLDSEAILPDGRSHLQQTVEVIASIVEGLGAPASAGGRAS